MFYRIGTQAELPIMEKKLPKAVYAKLDENIRILDTEYGAARNYMESGGYAVVLEAKEDLQALQRIVDYEHHPCEWADLEAERYLSALYLMNDDYGIVVIMPIAIAPKVILEELEEGI